MFCDYIYKLEVDSLQTYISTDCLCNVTDRDWECDNKYVRLSGIEFKYYKTKSEFRQKITKSKKLSLVINHLNKDEYMITIFDKDLKVIKRFKQNKKGLIGIK